MGNKLTVGSLFAGIGGICTGFKQAGFDVLWANEYDKKACETYRHNISGTNLIEKDIHQLSSNELEKVDIITAGFPCQAFSIAGYQQGFNDTKGRGNLFFETARIISDLKPSAFLLENVKNLAAHDHGNTIKVIEETIRNKLNYSFIPFVLNSKEYGNIPQTRERIYIVGFKNEGQYTAVDQKKDNNKNILTWRFKVPEPIKLQTTIHDILEKEKQQDNFYYKSTHKYYPMLKKEMKKKETVYQWRRVYVRENKSNLCPTLTANMGTGGHNVPLIIDQFGIRKLTPKECLNFQGFPEEFNFPPDMANSHCYKQAGNSVVVPVIKRIALSISNAITERR